ncbi:MAG: EAL domain-containing protein [Pseudoflavonifractor sp.]
MAQKSKDSLPQWRAYLVIIATLALLCIIVVFSSFQYYHKLQETVQAENALYLQEISKQISVNASKTIEDNFMVLGTMAATLKGAHITSLTQLGDIAREQQMYWDFQHILFIDQGGVAHRDDGHSFLLSSDAYLRKVIVDRERSLSSSQLMDGMECIVFALPLDGLVVDDVKITALAATYDLSNFDRLLSMTAFDGKGYGHIIRQDGTVVIRSSSPNAPQTGYNILASLSAGESKNAAAIDLVRANIAKGLSGQVELTLEDVPLYMSYTPLEAQEWCLLTFVPTSVATEKSTLFLNITLLLCALVTLVFLILIAILMFTSYRHKRKLEQLAFVDPVTGGNTMQRFYTQAAALLSGANGMEYALAYTNIGKFKVLNQQLGRNACDQILTNTSLSIRQNLDSHECSGRIFADNFCVLMKYDGEADLARRLNAWTESYNRILAETGSTWLPLTVEIGVYVIEDSSLSLPDMLDRAKLALRDNSRKLDANIHYRIYDERVHRNLLREKQLEDMMVSALKNREFQVYLQPKYKVSNEQIGGAEALVRWQSAGEGMIYPDEFIPIFEKNGFILHVDLWVFEQVCKTLRAWLDAGYTPVCISVNCSRVHIKTPNFLEEYRVIAERYAIPPALIEIELTENVVFEDVEHLTKIIADIQALGFSCSMDDFGSGYSSLNLIQDIPVDVLKLDKVFFRSNAAELARTESVVGSIITMARALSMKTVAEGVEQRFQVDMLKRLGCDYIQGYYYARPMPIPEFEALAFGGTEKI